MTTKEKLELDKKLLKVVSKEKASRELYNHCFPDRVLVEEYLEEKDKEKEAKKKEEEEKKARKAKKSSLSSRISLGTKKDLGGGAKK